MVAIIDYGAGNLQSVKKALDYIGADSVITARREVIATAEHVILPGVGSFGDAMDNMKKSGLMETVIERAGNGRPFLGICLGLQLLFESSEESPGIDGLGILKGKCLKFPADLGMKIPHVGWNSVTPVQREGVFTDIPEDTFMYFVHSYYVQAEDKRDIAAICQYGFDFTCAVQRGNLCAVQFHPEKSAHAGLQLLKNFVMMKGE